MTDRIDSAPRTHAAGPGPMPWWMKTFNPIARGLLAAGVPLGFNGLITIPGRKTGIERTTPVAIINPEAGGGSGRHTARSSGSATSVPRVARRSPRAAGPRTRGRRARRAAARRVLPGRRRSDRPEDARRRLVHPDDGSDRPDRSGRASMADRCSSSARVRDTVRVTAARIISERLDLIPLPPGAAAALPMGRAEAARIIGSILPDDWPLLTSSTCCRCRPRRRPATNRSGSG